LRAVSVTLFQQCSVVTGRVDPRLLGNVPAPCIYKRDMI